MVCLALELVGPWVLLDISEGMKMFDELLSINVPWSQEFSEFPRCGRSCTGGLSGFLVTEACVGFLVGGAGFLLSGVQ